jgi:hypothetical protein
MYDIDNKWVIGRSWHWTTPQKEFIVILYNDGVNVVATPPSPAHSFDAPVTIATMTVMSSGLPPM